MWSSYQRKTWRSLNLLKRLFSVKSNWHSIFARMYKFSSDYWWQAVSLYYRSSNQSHGEFNSFIKNLKLNLDKATTCNPFLIAVLGDFSAELCNWCINDKTNFKGAKNDKLTSRNRLHQIIKEPTHILDISFSCIDLFFTSQPKLVMDSGVHVSLHVNCHHQIIFPKFDFQIYWLHSIKELCGIIRMQTRIISKKLYAASIGKGLLQIKTQMKWSLFSMKLYVMI